MESPSGQGSRSKTSHLLNGFVVPKNSTIPQVAGGGAASKMLAAVARRRSLNARVQGPQEDSVPSDDLLEVAGDHQAVVRDSTQAEVQAWREGALLLAQADVSGALVQGALAPATTATATATVVGSTAAVSVPLVPLALGGVAVAAASFKAGSVSSTDPVSTTDPVANTDVDDTAAPGRNVVPTVQAGHLGAVSSWVAREVTFDQLKAITQASDSDADPLQFTITALDSGTLQKWNGSEWQAAQAGVTRLSSGEKLRWDAASGSGTTAAFKVKVSDGWADSASVQVSADVSNAISKLQEIFTSADTNNQLLPVLLQEVAGAHFSIDTTHLMDYRQVIQQRMTDSDWAWTQNAVFNAIVIAQLRVELGNVDALTSGGLESFAQVGGQLVRVNSFTTVGAATWTAVAGAYDYLIVGGGGAGGSANWGCGGGGGGGQVLTGSYFMGAAGVRSVVVGNGGTSAYSDDAATGNGQSSSMFGLSAAGGGGGDRGRAGDTGGGAVLGAGGTGGGGGSDSRDSTLGGGTPTALGADGAAGVAGGTSGGGGGAGGDASGATGGAGVLSAITGENVMYGAGGNGRDAASLSENVAALGAGGHGGSGGDGVTLGGSGQNGGVIVSKDLSAYSGQFSFLLGNILSTSVSSNDDMGRLLNAIEQLAPNWQIQKSTIEDAAFIIDLVDRLSAIDGQTAGGQEYLIFKDGAVHLINKFSQSGFDWFQSLAGTYSYLLVGGGGGGAGSNWGAGGGGGGGGVRSGTTTVGAGLHSVLVGAGGRGAYNNDSSVANGGASSLNDITALGGGGGSRGYHSNINPGAVSASGGGGGASTTGQNTSGGTTSEPHGDGASGVVSSRTSLQGGGGGGAGGDAIGATKGLGLSSSISGETLTYGAGGNGAIWGSTNATARADGYGNGGYGTSGGDNTNNGNRGSDGIVYTSFQSSLTEDYFLSNMADLSNYWGVNNANILEFINGTYNIIKRVGATDAVSTLISQGQQWRNELPPATESVTADPDYIYNETTPADPVNRAPRMALLSAPAVSTAVGPVYFYQQVWMDAFNGTGLDKDKWKVSGSREDLYWVSDGTLKMTSYTDSQTGQVRSIDIQTQDHFETRNGIWVASLRIQNAPYGSNYAMWMFPMEEGEVTGSWTPSQDLVNILHGVEYDIFEFSDGTTYASTIHTALDGRIYPSITSGSIKDGDLFQNTKFSKFNNYQLAFTSEGVVFAGPSGNADLVVNNPVVVSNLYEPLIFSAQHSPDTSPYASYMEIDEAYYYQQSAASAGDQYLVDGVTDMYFDYDGVSSLFFTRVNASGAYELDHTYWVERSSNRLFKIGKNDFDDGNYLASYVNATTHLLTAIPMEILVKRQTVHQAVNVASVTMLPIPSAESQMNGEKIELKVTFDRDVLCFDNSYVNVILNGNGRTFSLSRSSNGYGKDWIFEYQVSDQDQFTTQAEWSISGENGAIYAVDRGNNNINTSWLAATMHGGLPNVNEVLLPELNAYAFKRIAAPGKDFSLLDRDGNGILTMKDGYSVQELSNLHQLFNANGGVLHKDAEDYRLGTINLPNLGSSDAIHFSSINSGLGSILEVYDYYNGGLANGVFFNPLWKASVFGNQSDVGGGFPDAVYASQSFMNNKVLGIRVSDGLIKYWSDSDLVTLFPVLTVI